MRKLLLTIGLMFAVLAVLFVVFDADYFLARLRFSNALKNNQSHTALPQPPPNSLIIPSLNIAAPIVYATQTSESVFEQSLQNGVVHYPGTANPGQIGNCYIFGHSSDFFWSKGNYKTVFASLTNIKAGDVIYVTGQSKKFVYKVIQTKIVLPKDTQYLLPSNTKAMLTLQTSYPLGTALERFMVLAELQN